MNTYLGVMRWLWFKISGRVLFGVLHQVLRPIIFVQTQEIHSVHSLIYQSYSEFPASAETEQTIQVWRGFKNVFQHNLVMATTASRAKYSGGGNLLVLFSRLQWKQLYSLRIYKDKGIATSRLYQQLSHRSLNFRNHHQFEQIWFWIKESV